MGTLVSAHSRRRSCYRLVGSLALVALLRTPPLESQQTRGDSLRVVMGQMQEMFAPMMERGIVRTFEATLELLARPETAERLATYFKNLHDALVAKGFTKEEAMRIVTATRVPIPSPQ